MTCPPSMNGQPLRAAGERPALARRRRRARAAQHRRDRAPPQHRALLLDAGGRRRGRRRPRHRRARGAARHRPDDAPAARAAGARDGGAGGRRAPGGHLPGRSRAVGADRVARPSALSPPWSWPTSPWSPLAVLGPWRRRRLGPPLAVLARHVRSPWSATCSPARTWSSTGCWATTRSSPAGSPATATSPSGCCRSARLTVTAAAATWLGRRAGPGRAPDGHRGAPCSAWGC